MVRNYGVPLAPDPGPPEKIPLIGIALVAGFVILLVAMIFSVLDSAWPHSDYPPLCCNGTDTGGDCHPVACDSIVETREGYEWNGFKFNESQVHPSFNGECHACVSTWHNLMTGKDSHNPHCIFIQPNS